MKKRTLVNLVLLSLLLFGSVASQANGEDRVVLGNWVNPMNLELVRFDKSQTVILFPNSILKVNFKVTVADDELTNHPELYIQYSFGPYSGLIGPLHQSEFYPVTLSGGEEAFRASYPLEFQFEDECANATNELFDLPISISLVKFKGSTTELYPVLYYPNLFPVGWFEETIIPFPAPEYSAIKHVDCIGVTPGRSDKPELSLKSSLQIHRLSPNPFRDELTLVYQNPTTSNVSIRLSDTFGKLLYERKGIWREAGLQEELLQLDFLAPGLYYLHLFNASSSQTLKLVKN